MVAPVVFYANMKPFAFLPCSTISQLPLGMGVVNNNNAMSPMMNPNQMNMNGGQQPMFNQQDPYFQQQNIEMTNPD